MNPIKTVEQHILEEEHRNPHVNEGFVDVMKGLVLAAKTISRDVNRAGLAKTVLGKTDSVNVHGETITKLDDFAHNVICQALGDSGSVCVMASEESEDIISVPEGSKSGEYVALFDPLDGSSNIDVNISIGTIFSLHRRMSNDDSPTAIDCLQPGFKQIAAGYFIYGSSTMMVYTVGAGVHGFTLDPIPNEFVLSHESIQMPQRGKIYSINEGNHAKWDEGTRKYVSYLKQDDAETNRPYSMRYIGSLVADFHRNLLKGGIFLYPGPKAKLRLLYEAAPLAMVAEQAGGLATNGIGRIMDIQPSSLHQRVPLIIGSHDDVLKHREFMIL